MVYTSSGKIMYDVRTLMEITHYKKSTMIRLLKKRDVPFFTYQNRRIYSVTEIIEKLGDKINIEDLTKHSAGEL